MISSQSSCWWMLFKCGIVTGLLLLLCVCVFATCHGGRFLTTSQRHKQKLLQTVQMHQANISQRDFCSCGTTVGRENLNTSANTSVASSALCSKFVMLPFPTAFFLCTSSGASCACLRQISNFSITSLQTINEFWVCTIYTRRNSDYKLRPFVSVLYRTSDQTVPRSPSCR